MGQVVDTETAKEFMAETLERVDPAVLGVICTEVEAKSVFFQEMLGEERLSTLSENEFRAVMQRIFSVRRKVAESIELFGFERMRDWTRELIHGEEEIESRFQSFVDKLEGIPENTRRDWASEILHFSRPDRCWLWTRWMWDPKVKTGALPLVTTASYDLSGDSSGEIYMKVGRAVAFVHEVGEAAGFQRMSRSIFGTDVFLSCVYVVYAYTVLRMRMTQEFNKVMPGLPEFSRRLLGVNHERPQSAAAAGA